MGPIVAPKILPPRDIRDPRLLHMKAMHVARSPNIMEIILVMVVSFLAEMPLKQENCEKSNKLLNNFFIMFLMKMLIIFFLTSFWGLF